MSCCNRAASVLNTVWYQSRLPSTAEEMAPLFEFDGCCWKVYLPDGTVATTESVVF